MTVHMVKLCVGAESMEDMIAWQIRQMRTLPNPIHRTRAYPKQADAMRDGGSIYWVVKRAIRFRQRIIDIRRVENEEGGSLCELHFDPELIETFAQPKRPFQGWRYLQTADAPRDLRENERSIDMPADLDEALKAALVW